ncbi:hypothetical protein SAMN05216312_102467 [Cohnella sp. OV330]|uniref:hypothetical protein n=1 Tax=Cohnella sp. OV330 TaxID=1855288 RepID=UPI0008E94547|nr:hypothetical protein [Cohnella sp. OV330]SFA95232.1 hypothetical protein SAMN05216312_102467 [Cohnella sp. OV330]
MRLVLLLAPAGTIALALMFMYANPYAEHGVSPLNASTIAIAYLLLILPALAVAASIVLRSRRLKWLSFCASLPVGLYLGLAGVPSLWTLFLLFIGLYAFIPVYRSTLRKG